MKASQSEQNTVKFNSSVSLNQEVLEVNQKSFTPRFNEACRREGINHGELIKKSKEEIINIIKTKDPTGQILIQTTLDKVESHLDERRLKKLYQVRQARQRILQEEKQGLWPPEIMSRIIFSSKSHKHNNSMSLAEKQNKLLENIKRRQDSEMEKMIEYEKKVEDIQKVNMEKIQLQYDKEQQREETLRKKRFDTDIKRQKLEEDRRNKESQEQLQNQSRIFQQEKKEKQRIAREKENEIKLKEEQAQREDERSQKQYFILTSNRQQKMQLEQDLFHRKQNQAAAEKQSQMLQKDLKRQDMINQRNSERSKLADQERLHMDYKLDQVKRLQEKQIQKKRDDYESQQHLNEKKKQDFDVQQEIDKKQSQQDADRKQEQIKQILFNNKLKEEGKVQLYQDKVQALEQKKKDLEGEVRLEQEKKLQKYRDKESKIRLVLQKNDQLAEKTKEQLVQKLDKTQLKLNKIEMKKNEDLQNKQICQLISRFVQTLLRDIETQENLSKQESINVNKRERLEEKLAKDEMRRSQLQQKLFRKYKRTEKDNIMKLSESIRKDAEEKRQKQLLDFDLKRRTNQQFNNHCILLVKLQIQVALRLVPRNHKGKVQVNQILSQIDFLIYELNECFLFKTDLQI